MATHRFCEFKNLDATFVVDRFSIGQGEFPRVRSNEKVMVKLHETFNVKSEVKTSLNRHELQGIPETSLILCTSKNHRKEPATHLLIKATLCKNV